MVYSPVHLVEEHALARHDLLRLKVHVRDVPETQVVDLLLGTRVLADIWDLGKGVQTALNVVSVHFLVRLVERFGDRILGNVLFHDEYVGRLVLVRLLAGKKRVAAAAEADKQTIPRHAVADNVTRYEAVGGCEAVVDYRDYRRLARPGIAGYDIDLVELELDRADTLALLLGPEQKFLDLETLLSHRRDRILSLICPYGIITTTSPSMGNLTLFA